MVCRSVLAVVVAVGALSFSPSPPAETRLSAQDQKKIDKFKMLTYQAVFISKGPKWTGTEAPEAQPVLTAHRNYVRELLTTGRAVIAGELSGAAASSLTAVYILTGTPEQAKEVAAADPGVKDGRSVEIFQWMGPEGWFGKPAGALEAETIYFGFLVNGPNRGQDAETAKQMQRGHRDYMDGQSKLGKLVLAGPLLDGGTRRGLIAYRVPTMEEAIERASGDPMVKAGRLAVELYAWNVPKGILK